MRSAICVCGYPAEKHPMKHCEKFQTMDLPEGKTCGDCHNFRVFCRGVIGKPETSWSCDYFPVRFVQRQETRHA